MRCILICWIIGLVSFNKGLGQTLSGVETLGEKEGLHYELAHSFAQDADGFIWMGMREGLVRYDGYEFVHYNNFPNNPNQIPYKLVKKIFFIDEDHLAIFAKNHAYLLNRHTNEITYLLPEDNRQKAESILDIFDAQNGTVWLITSYQNDLYVKVWQRGQALKTLVKIPEKERNHYFSYESFSLQSMPNGELWFLNHYKGLEIYDQQLGLKRTISLSYQQNNPTPSYQLILDQHRNSLWFITGNFSDERYEVSYFNLATETFETPPVAFSKFCSNGFADHKGDIWLISNNYENSFYKLTTDDQLIDYSKSIENNLSIPFMSGIFEDKDQNIWIGSRETMVIPNKKLDIQTYLKNNSQEEPNSFFGIFEDPAGTIYAKTQTPGSLFSLDPQNHQTQKVQLYKDGTQFQLYGSNREYFYDKKGQLWGLTTRPDEREKGLVKLDVDKQTIEVVDTTLLEYLYPVASRAYTITRDGRMVLGGTPQKLISYDLETGNHYPILPQDSLEGEYLDIFKIIEGQDSTLWVCMWRDGLFHIQPREGVIKHYTVTSTPPISSNYVSSLVEEPNGEIIWIGTHHGLTKLDLTQHTTTFFDQSDGLADNTVSELLPYEDDHLVVGTFNGLSIFNKSNQTFTNYFEEDGLTHNRLRYYSAYQAKNGRFYWGSINGLNAFYPKDLLPKEEKNSLTLTKLMTFEEGSLASDVQNQQLDQLHKINIAPTVSWFQINYTLLNYLKTDKSQFQTWMEGLENDWVNQGNKASIRYNRLPPGNYQLHIKGKTAKGDWTDSITIPIEVHTYFYLTNWAFGFYFLMAIGAIFYGLKYQLRRRNEQAEAARLKELDAFKSRFYTNITHEFRTPLTVISGMTELVKAQPEAWLKNGSEMIQRNSQNLLRLVNQLLDLSKLESGKLQLNWIQSDLLIFLKYLQESYESYAKGLGIQIVFESDIASQLMDYDQDKIQAIISNLLSNAIKFSKAGSTVSLKISKVNRPLLKEQLKIAVIDEGVGISAEDLPFIFDRFYQVDSSTTREGEGTGIGLALTKELVGLMDGTIEVHSQLQQGTTFFVSLPITQNAPIQTILNQPTPVIDSSTPILNEDSSANVEQNGQPQLLVIEDNVEVRQYLAALKPCKKSIVLGDLLSKETLLKFG